MSKIAACNKRVAHPALSPWCSIEASNFGPQSAPSSRRFGATKNSVGLLSEAPILWWRPVQGHPFFRAATVDAD